MNQPTNMIELIAYIGLRFEMAGKAFEKNLGSGGDVANMPNRRAFTPEGNTAQSETIESTRRRPAEISACKSAAETLSDDRQFRLAQEENQ